jgi:hypothetical protein
MIPTLDPKVAFAFGAGVATFFAPCAYPLLPGYVGYCLNRLDGDQQTLGPILTRGLVAGGGVVATRTLRWPGGDLVLNADTRGGEITVRVSDASRQPIEGFDHTDCVPFRGDDTDRVIRWRGGSLDVEPKAADEIGGSTPPLIVDSEAYHYAGGQLVFTGRVRVQHPRWYLECPRLVLHLLPEANRIRQVVAEQGVKFGQIQAASEDAGVSPWSIQCQTVTVEMTDNGERVQRIIAEKEVVYEQGTRRATGKKATFDADTGDVELTGDPVFENDQIVLTEASVLIWNRYHQGLAALGGYNIHGKLTKEELSSEAIQEP